MKTSVKFLVVAALAVSVVGAVILKNRGASRNNSESAEAQASELVPEPGALVGMPRLVEVGAGKCIPCKMMAPVLAELKKEYAGHLRIDFVDVWVNPDAGKPFKVEVIPTQIFYDINGVERFRHVGFFGKEEILGKWKELGVDLSSGIPPTSNLPKQPVPKGT